MPQLFSELLTNSNLDISLAENLNSRLSDYAKSTVSDLYSIDGRCGALRPLRIGPRSRNERRTEARTQKKGLGTGDLLDHFDSIDYNRGDWRIHIMSHPLLLFPDVRVTHLSRAPISGEGRALVGLHLYIRTSYNYSICELGRWHSDDYYLKSLYCQRDTSQALLPKKGAVHSGRLSMNNVRDAKYKDNPHRQVAGEHKLRQLGCNKTKATFLDKS
jgi:hypothetical protein